jgi:hypothetical protein
VITFEEAKQIALNHIHPDCALVEDEISEKPYGWYFFYQSRAYLQSGNILDRLIGGGGFIVDRDDGYVFEFGSGYPLSRNLKAYEAGFKYDSYDLKIVSINSFQETLDWLLTLSMPYYGKDNLESVLMSLPYTFFNQGLWFRAEEFLTIDQSKCCQYELYGRRIAKPAILVRQNAA